MHIARSKHGALYIVGHSGAVGWHDAAPHSLARVSYEDQDLIILLDKEKTEKLMATVFKILEEELDG